MTEKKEYREESISSIKDFIDLIEAEKSISEVSGNYVDFLFRGQSKDKPLIPKLARGTLKDEIINTEKLIITEFKRTSIPLLELQPENEWDWLALAQHHGMPT